MLAIFAFVIVSVIQILVSLYRYTHLRMLRDDVSTVLLPSWKD